MPIQELKDTSFLIDLAFGFIKTECLFSSFDLDIYEQLEKHGPQTYQDLAKLIDVPDHHLEKLLNFVAMEGVIDKETREDGSEVFSINDVSRMHCLRESKVPGKVFLGDWIKLLQEFKTPKGELTKAIKAGKQTRTKDNNVYTTFEKQQEIRRLFQAGMAVIAQTASPLVDAFDLSCFKTYVDLGGGTGHYARAMAERYPDMDVAVCDLPNVCKTAEAEPANKDTKVKFIPGDFFKGDLPKADLYSINHVLHNWNDESCDKIMAAAKDAINPGGSVLILDSILQNDKMGPARTNLTEVAQIVQHEGKHRTLSEFETMLSKHGFGEVRFYRYKGFGFYDGLIAKKMD